MSAAISIRGDTDMWIARHAAQSNIVHNYSRRIFLNIGECRNIGEPTRYFQHSFVLAGRPAGMAISV